MSKREAAGGGERILFEADARELPARLGEDARLLGAVEAQDRLRHAGMAPHMRAERDILDHAHRLDQLHMLEGAGNAAFGDVAQLDMRQRFAPERNRTGIVGQYAGQQVERRALARAVRADQAENAAGGRREADIVDGDEAAEDLAHRPDVEKRRSARRLLAQRQRRAGGLWQFRGRRRAGDQRPQPVGGELQHQHEDRAEDDRLVIAGRADEQRHDVLQLVAQDGDAGSAEQCAPQASRATRDRHQEIFGARRDAEGARAHRTLEMGVEPAGKAGEDGGIDEDEKLHPRRVDAERGGDQRAAPQHADRAADAAVEQVAGRDHREHHDEPDQDVIFARISQRMRPDADRRDAGQAVMRAEPCGVAEQIEEGDAPGDRAERHVMAREPHRHRADEQRAKTGDDQRRRQGEPGRDAPVDAEHGARIGAEADESRLTEGGHAADARQQHEAERHEARDADIAEQRDPEIRQPEIGDDQQEKRDDRPGPAFHGAHSSSSAPWPPSDRNSRKGMMIVKTSTSL